MKDDLSAAPFHIKQQFVSGLADTLFLGHLPSHADHPGHDDAIRLLQFVDASDMLSRHHQQVYRSVGVDVLEDHQGIIFI